MSPMSRREQADLDELLSNMLSDIKSFPDDHQTESGYVSRHQTLPASPSPVGSVKVVPEPLYATIVKVNGHSTPKSTVNTSDRSKSPMTRHEQDELDSLLTNMLREIQSFPDCTPTRPTSRTSNVVSSKPNSPSAATYSVPVMPVTNGEHIDSHIYNNHHHQSQPTHHQLQPVGGGEAPPASRFLTRPTNWTAHNSNDIDSVTNKVKPYHARPGSQPFTYGVTAASPVIQRRRVHSESTAYVCENKPRCTSAGPAYGSARTQQSSPPLRRPATPPATTEAQQVYARIVRQGSFLNSPVSHTSSVVNEVTVPISPIPDSEVFSDTASDILDAALLEGEAALSWLERQQQKLKVKPIDNKDLPPMLRVS